MNINDIVTIIFSSTLLATIITSVFNLLINNRKDSVDNIIKERKTWRDEMRVISLSIIKSKNIKQLKIAISELKVRINAYGIVCNSFLADTHIWKQILKVESKKSLSPKKFYRTKCMFVNQISCLLKYDWERSKSEIQGNIQTIAVIVSLIISFLLYSIRWFYNYNIGYGQIINYLSSIVIFTLFFAFAIWMISFADKWKNAVQFYAFIIFSILFMIGLYCFMYILPHALPYNIIDWIISLVPFVTLIYCSITKLLTYRQNVGHFILASASACDANKIHKKYRIFFSRKSYTYLLTGKK